MGSPWPVWDNYESGKREFGLWLSQVPWEQVLSQVRDPSEQGRILSNILMEQTNKIFSTKSCRISNQDLSFVMSDIKKINMYMKREYRLRGKSINYYRLEVQGPTGPSF